LPSGDYEVVAEGLSVEASVDRNQRLRGQQNLYWLLGDPLPSSEAQDESRRNGRSALYWAGWPFCDEELVQI
jgi:hypothetical protein